MQDDFTSLDFGWWRLQEGSQPDMYEYGASRAAAWDCAFTLQDIAEELLNHHNTADTLEILRRWEDVRKKKWLTQEQKEQLKDAKQEHILLINEAGEYELAPYWELETGAEDVSAFFFSRSGKNYVVCWHKTGSGTLTLPLEADRIAYETELGGTPIAVQAGDGCVQLPLTGRAYLSTELSEEAVREAFRCCQCQTQ